MDQCPTSSVRSKKIKNEEEGLEDRFEHLGDIWTEIRGHELFLFGYKRRKAPEPISNLWKRNLGKLVVPNVFVDVELMKALVDSYDPKTKTIYDYRGNPMVAINKQTIDMVFDLDWDVEEKIDMHKLSQEFFNLEDIYRKWRLPIHRPKVGGSIIPFSKTDKVPFDVNQFHPYFKYTYYATAQVLGLEAHPLMDIGVMVLCADLQSKDPMPFDYATYVAEALNHGLEKLKGNLVNIHFSLYSLLLHVILYCGQESNIWSDDFSMRAYDKSGLKKPVQLWVSAWDQRFTNNQYWHFQECFVKPLSVALRQHRDYTLSPEIKRFLRPKDFSPESQIDYNWGDWYCHPNHTEIRIFGYEGKPYMLPITVPNRVASLEIVRQLSVVSAKHLTDFGKQFIVPRLLVFSDFIVKSSKSYHLLQNKLDYYGMTLGNPRENFDPEGYVKATRTSQKLRAGIHVAQMPDDLIRNLEREEAKALRERFEMTWEAFKWKRVRGKVDGNLLGDLQDPLEIAKKLLQHEAEIMHKVPPQFLHFIKTGRDSEPLAHMSQKSTASSIPADSPREDYPLALR